MRLVKSAFSLCLFFIICNTNGHAQEAGEIKLAFRAGIECGNYVTAKSNSYAIKPGFTFGLLNGVNLYTSSPYSLILGIDTGLRFIMSYDQEDMKYWSGYKKIRDIFDVEHLNGFFELGVLPTVMMPMGEEVQGRLYAGAYGGLGFTDGARKLISRMTIDSSQFTSYDEGSPPRHNILTSGGATGASVYFKSIMLDVRYQYTFITEQKSSSNLYFQLGVVL